MCKLQRACTFAHGEKELEAWNDHLEKMEKRGQMKTQEGKEEKTTGGRFESTSNKVNYYGMQPRCNYDSIFFIGLRKTSDFLFLATSSLWPDGCSDDLYTEEMFHLNAFVNSIILSCKKALKKAFNFYVFFYLSLTTVSK